MIRRRAYPTIVHAPTIPHPSTGRFLQEDPIWFEAGDLNVYRYVWNSPANWTDPSGMAAAGQYASTLAVPVALMGGTIATQRMLSTASGTARYLASADKNALSTIGAAIACTFYALADALNTAMRLDMQIFGVSGCGVLAGSIAPNDPPEGKPADDPAEPCDVQLDADLMMCKTIAAMKGGGYSTKKGRKILRYAKVKQWNDMRLA
ncbi:RHS repeat-associated core domain-containing protein [Agrobacterium pusense]|uniref:RHS repeat-associated core domain-containing protein n=1 Tax=Agrobacterium pusense TaxID=648995 RepID=UPI002F3EF78D